MSIDKHKLESIIRENVDLLIKKNEDYSSMNITVEGIQGVCTRLVDKIARLRNLLGKDKGDINYESISDTLADITNYGLIGQLLDSGGWGQDIESILILHPHLNDKLINELNNCDIPIVLMDNVYDTNYKHKFDIIRKMVDVTDALMIFINSNYNPIIFRMIEYARINNKIVIIIDNKDVITSNCNDVLSTGCNDCQLFNSIEDAIQFIKTAGL
mgnify:CR=1 FL=1